MTTIQNELMLKLYGYNIWNNYIKTDIKSDLQGWNGNHSSLSRLVSTSNAKIVIDVGVWKGQSTINMAKSLKQNNIDGVVIAIDTFLGSSEHWHLTDEYISRIYGRPTLYEIFLNNVFENELMDYIIPMPQTSITSAKILNNLNIKAAIIHIDAAHEYTEVLRDAEEYWKILSEGGYLIGDDYDPGWNEVIQAANDFSKNIKKSLIIEPPKWIIQK